MFAALDTIPFYRADPTSAEYGLTPLDYARTPRSPWRSRFDDDLIAAHLDALTAAALVGVETSRIEIGTAVVPVQPRHPIALAQQVLSTQAVCEGRLSLGLGVSHHWVIEEMLGLPYDKPLATLRAHDVTP